MKDDYARERLMTLHPTTLRAMIVERTHRAVEIPLYQALARGKRLSRSRGDSVREMLAIWKERHLPMDLNSPDWAWVHAMLDMAARQSRGEEVDLSPFAWEPFDESQRAVARQLIHQRRSIRRWTDERVPDWMIDEILEAGLRAPHGCNLCSLRFLVVREENLPGLLAGSEISSGSVHIVACQDRRAYDSKPNYVADPELLERNRLLDCGAAMQTMLLMAHALGLGAVWLTFSRPMRQRVRDHFGLEDEIQIVTFLDVGFPAQTPMPPGRMTLDEVLLARV